VLYTVLTDLPAELKACWQICQHASERPARPIVTGRLGTVAGVPTLLVVHHTPSPAMQELLEAVLAGAKADGIEGVEVRTRAALTASPVDVLEADGFLLGTPANIGYLSGAMKHFFDGIYYPTMTEKPGAPYGLWVYGNNDTQGAVRAAESITRALGWTKAHEAVTITGGVDKAARDACFDLGGTLAASVMG
jgi:multimeric flavodoxin WrbA